MALRLGAGVYYLERLMEWFHDLEWKRKTVVAGAGGLVLGISSAVGGPVLVGLLLGLMLVDLITDDVLDVHGR